MKYVKNTSCETETYHRQLIDATVLGLYVARTSSPPAALHIAHRTITSAPGPFHHSSTDCRSIDVLRLDIFVDLRAAGWCLAERLVAATCAVERTHKSGVLAAALF